MERDGYDNADEPNNKEHPPDEIATSVDNDANHTTTNPPLAATAVEVSTDLTSSELSRGSSPSEEGQESLLQKKWDEMFSRLRRYKEKNGDCLVPNRYPDDPQLGNWVSTQRRQYKILKEGGTESTPMTQARADKLESIGFKWSTKDPRHVPWMTRYQELVVFKEKYGHSQVPIGWEGNIQLSNWISTQRQEYKLLQKGRSSRLTDERIELLNRVDFIWEAQRGGPRRRRKATVQVPSKANPVEGVGPRAAKRPAYGTTTPQRASVQGFNQGFPMIANPSGDNTNANPSMAAAASQFLQNSMATGLQIPWQLLQQGTFQAQGSLPPNMMLPMATAHYTQWLAALSALASVTAAASQKGNASSQGAPPQPVSNYQPGPTAVDGGQGPSSSPKTVSMTESDQRDSDQKTSDHGEEASSDESPGCSD